MNNIILFFTGFIVLYIIVLIVYFLRRSKSHEKELTTFLESAKGQVDLHKKAADKQAQEKVAKAMFVVKKVQDVASVFEEHSKEEYERIIQAAKAKEKEILSEAKLEAKKIVQDAEGDLDEFKIERMQEVERNMVKMVMAVTEKVLEQSLTTRQHKELIYQALDEIKTKKSRS